MDSTHSLVSEPKSWVIQKNGKPILFYSTIEAAIEGYYELKLRGSEATTIQGLQNYIKSVVSSLNSALTPLSIKVQSSTKGGHLAER